MLPDHYCHQTTNDFKKFLEQKDAKNISKIATPILLITDMHIWPTSLLEISIPNSRYDFEKKLPENSISANWGEDFEIKEVMATNNKINNNEKDF